MEAVLQCKKEDFKCEEETIGAGGESIVYKAHHGTFGIKALKIWHHPREFLVDNEVSILLKLEDHKNIVRIDGLIISNQKGFIRGYFLKLMDCSLRTIIHNQDTKGEMLSSPPREYNCRDVAKWIRQIKKGLSFLHSNNIIHRDIKPENILLEGKTLKLADFGISRTHADETLTTRVGTHSYKAPEIASGKYDHQVDIYAFAITIWEILHRRKPQLQDRQRPIIDIRFPDAVKKFLERGWNQKPSLRPTFEDIDLFSGYLQLWCKTEIVSPSFDPSKTIEPAPSRSNTEQSETVFIWSDYPSPNILVLNTENQSWRQLSLRLPLYVYPNAFACVDGRIFLLGHTQKNSPPTTRTYELVGNSWVRKADMNIARQEIHLSTVVLDGYIWVAGGSRDDREDIPKTFERYDPVNNEWSIMPLMQTGKFEPRAVAIGRRIFVFQDQLGDLVEYYDVDSAVWSTTENFPLQDFRIIRADTTFNTYAQFSASGYAQTSNVDLHLSEIHSGHLSGPSSDFVFVPFMSCYMADAEKTILITCDHNMFYSYVFDGEEWVIGPKFSEIFPLTINSWPTQAVRNLVYNCQSPPFLYAMETIVFEPLLYRGE